MKDKNSFPEYVSYTTQAGITVRGIVFPRFDHDTAYGIYLIKKKIKLFKI